ncbi:TetR/AcrR family transcriptional regulator [Metabacillus sp. KIGAM252]|uniref:TetR/AcrR family transcriptional regulator n=1 Tax=Metabacillus flavus TaxID=2823519 RepID=A0ABS5LAN2_9BACI|nr:TetR/AcrR family transcriptional regulator [Metabacillus flavus]MBS2967771.1 TetR/AcrR family transcriptional regulator [Metabacillus flavus]
MVKRLTMEEKRRQTTENLLDAAEKIFANKGFGGASVDEIAEEAGYSKGAVYSNFTNKENLFLALYDRRVQKQGQDWEQVFSGMMNSFERSEKVNDLLQMQADSEKARQWNMLMMEFTLFAMRNEGIKEKFVNCYTTIFSSMKKALESHFLKQGQEVSSNELDDIVLSLFSLESGLNVIESIAPELVSNGFRIRNYSKFL